MEDINTKDIVDIIQKKIDAENLTRFFNTKSYNAKGRSLNLDPSNCMLLEFPTLKSKFPELYDSSVYRLLIILELYKEEKFSHHLQNEFKRFQQKYNIDRIVLWNITDLSNEIVQSLKNINVDLFLVKIPNKSDVQNKAITNFILVQGKSTDYSLIVNLTADYLTERLKKMFHLILSEIAAPIYDDEYGKKEVATNSIMRFEETKLQSLIKRLASERRNDIAVDVGCGTGRHSFILSKKFNNVYAYDFSPKMIKEAEKGKRQKEITNIIFAVNDFEYETFLDEDQFYGKCDLIVASFGMGSFIGDTAKMLRRFYDWLKPEGYIFISFYNGDSITLKLTPNWRDIPLSAQIDVENNSLEVTITPETRFNVFCKPFSVGTKGVINKIFNIDEIYTYPTIMALLPNTLLEDDLAYSLFSYVDEALSESKEHQLGHYVIVTGHKPGVTIDGYSNIEKLLKDSNYKYEIIEHSPVLSVEDVKKEIGYYKGQMIKTIIFKYKKTGDFLSVSLPSEKRIDKNNLSKILGTSVSRIKFVSEKEVLKIGFPIGGIAPFGFNDDIKIIKFIDEAIDEVEGGYLYMGIGNNRKTLKIKKEDFLNIVKNYQRITL